MSLFKKKEKEKREANLTLYGAGSDLTDFYEKVQSVFGEYVLAMEKVKTNQLQMTLVDNTEINFFITENPAEMFNQTNGMSNYFSQAPMENMQVKEAALQQIRMFTCIIGITFELTEDNNRTNFIAGSVHELGRQITAFVLYPNMSLYHPEGKLLISIQGETEFEEYYAIMCKEMVIPTQEENEKDQARKARNLEILKEKGIPYIEHMGVSAYDATSEIPAKEDILLRAIAVFACCVKSEVYTCGRYEDVIEKNKEQVEMLEELYGFQKALSTEEKYFLEQESPNMMDLNKFGWRYECCAVLLWALNLVKMKQPTEICDAAELGGIIWNNDWKSLLEKAVLRDRDELLNFQDLVHRYDWACIEARIKKLELPMLNEEIVCEWHYALNWLTGVEGVTDWDEVPRKA